jgi:DNA-binding GntR family transcriptional regulator
MQLTRLKRESAVDAVHNSLRQAILNSLLRPGERLDVSELAEKLGVSLTPVRNAVHLLASEGLVEIRPRSGTFVTVVTAEDVRETFDIRCALECLAAERAIANIGPEEIRRLKTLLKNLRRAGRTTAHEQYNAEFHLVIVHAAGNKRLLEMYTELNAHIRIARIHAAEADWTERLAQEQSEHEEIVEAIGNHQTGRLIKALRLHIFRARDAMVAAIASKDGHKE